MLYYFEAKWHWGCFFFVFEHLFKWSQGKIEGKWPSRGQKPAQTHRRSKYKTNHKPFRNSHLQNYDCNFKSEKYLRTLMLKSASLLSAASEKITSKFANRPCEELIENAKSGDAGAYEEIVRRFQKTSLAYAYSVLGDYQLAEDATQEAFLAAYLDLMQLREPKAFPGWLRRIVTNQALSLLRSNRGAAVTLADDFDVISTEAGPDLRAQEGEIRQRVAQEIDRLPAEEAQVAHLYFLQQEKQTAIALRLRIPLNTVKSRLHRARASLQQELVGLLKPGRKQDMQAHSLIRQAATEEAIEQLRLEREQLLRVPTRDEILKAAELLCAEGRLQRMLGRAETAIKLFSDGLRSSGLKRDPVVRARLRAEIGISYMKLAKYPQAEKSLSVASTMLRGQSKPSSLMPAILNGLGTCAWGKGNFHRARRLFDRAIIESRRVNCDELEATALNNISLIDWKRGELNKAIEGFKQCRMKWQKIGNRHGLAQTLVNVGILEENMGRLSSADQNYRKALQLAKDLGFLQLEAVVYSNMANLALVRGESNQSLIHGKEAVTLAQRTGDLRSEAIAHENLALASIDLKKWENASKGLLAARKIAKATADNERLFSLDLVEIELALARNEQTGLGAKLRALEKVVVRRGYNAELGRLYRIWGHVELAGGQAASAGRRLKTALGHAQKQGNKPEEKRILALEKQRERQLAQPAEKLKSKVTRKKDPR